MRTSLSTASLICAEVAVLGQSMVACRLTDIPANCDLRLLCGSALLDWSELVGEVRPHPIAAERLEQAECAVGGAVLYRYLTAPRASFLGEDMCCEIWLWQCLRSGWPVGANQPIILQADMKNKRSSLLTSFSN